MAKRLFYFVGITSFAIACHVGSASGQPSITFISDTSWKAFAMNSDGSQGESLGSTQCVGWSPYFADLSAIPGACWMWMPGVDASSPADLQGAYFSKSFDLPGVPISGTIFIAADDFAEVQINGSLVGSIGSITDYTLAAAAQAALVQFDLSPFLQYGPNRITVKSQNGPSSFSGGKCNPCNYGGNRAGVVFGGTLNYDVATRVQASSWGSVKARHR